jgi:putative ABC transport system permease protein
MAERMPICAAVRGLIQDVKYGIRLMAKSPWFTAAAVLTLALGIGVNSAGFSIANGFWWKRLPFENPKEVVTLAMSDGTGQPNEARMNYPEFVDIRARVKSLKAITAVQQTAVVLSSDGSPGQRYNGATITPNLFSFLGVKPIRGRDLTVADEKWGPPLAVLISHDLWQTKYGGQEDVVGRVLRLDTNPAVIVGVMPPGFKFPFAEQVWSIKRPYEGESREYRGFYAFGRLADGVGIQQARAEVSAIAQAIAQDHPKTNKGFDAVVLTFPEWMSGPDDNSWLNILLAAVAFILLIACANTANLLLSRAVQRAREVSVRTALGASRWRIARQVLVESLMLSLAAGVLGFFVGQAGVRWFSYSLASNGAELPFWMTFDLDYRAFAYFFAICIATGIAFGSIPALQISRTNMNDNLKEGSHQTSGGSRARRMAAALLVAEIAMTVMLVSESGILLRELFQLTRLDLGVEEKNLITARLDIPYARYANEKRPALLEDFVRNFQRPDRLTTFAFKAPMEGNWYIPFQLQDRDIADATGKLPLAATLPVGNTYFTTLNVKLVRGRNFEAHDGKPGAEVVIVNRRFAEQYWPSENPLGKRLRIFHAPQVQGGPGGAEAPWLTVVGVSPDIFQGGDVQSGAAGPTVYVPHRLNSSGGQATILVRSAQTESTVRELRAELAKIDPDLAPFSIKTFDEVRRSAFWGNRFFTTLIGMLSLMALAMASVGLYGVTAHGVSQRTREIGIRAALGASRFRVIWMVVRQSLPRIVIGLAMGCIASIAIGLVDLRDFSISGSTLGILALVTITAVLVPAWRASRLNPYDALRSD